MKKSILIFFLLVLFIPLSTKAAGLVPCGGSDDPSTIKDESLPCTVCDLLVLFQNVLKKALEFAFLIVIVFIVYGGFCWIFSGGNETNIKAGMKIITNAMIGLMIVLCAWLIVNTVFWLIAQIGGKEEYTGSWWHLECPNPAEAPAEAPEAPIESVEPDNGGTSEPTEPVSKCYECGAGAMWCTKAECDTLEGCTYFPYFPFGPLWGYCKPTE